MTKRTNQWFLAGYLQDHPDPLGASYWTDIRIRDAMAAIPPPVSVETQLVAAIGKAFSSAGGYNDSIDRELAFALMQQKYGADPEKLYECWLHHTPSDWGE
jgi:hypothetical protein